MRSSTAGSADLMLNRGVSLQTFTFKRVSRLLAVASALVVVPAFAQEPEVKVIRKGPAVRTQRAENRAEVRADARAQAAAEPAPLPKCLEKLNLNAQQQAQVKEIVHSYDGAIQAALKQFADSYLKTVCLETELMAAIEDTLTESQRQKVREQRRLTGKHNHPKVATEAKSEDETEKPAAVVDEGLAAVGITLNEEQEFASDKVQEQYRGRMRSMNREIERLHNQLVSLEADKLVEIEKVLTKEQLTQLRMNRQTVPARSNKETAAKEKPVEVEVEVAKPEPAKAE